MANSKISVDLISRSFEIEVPEQQVQSTLEYIEKLLKLPVERTTITHGGADVRGATPDRESAPEATAKQGPSDSDDTKPTKKKRTTGSKPKSYHIVDLGLAPEQREDIRNFFNEKAPKTQNEQVAVLGLKMKEHKGKESFTTDEIHSAFKIVNKPTPRNLEAVFGNMKRDGKGDYEDSSIVINSLTDDFVNFYMNSEKD